MIEVYLIRHGQASFSAEDYDKLSNKGIVQAKHLGAYWQRIYQCVDHIPIHYYSGSLLRHQQTAQHFFDTLSTDSKRRANIHENITTHAGFNEFNHEDVLKCYNPNWLNFQAMHESVTSCLYQEKDVEQASRQAMHSFQHEFLQAMKRWVSGDYHDYQESWLQFQHRCITSLHEVISSINSNTTPQKKRLVVFTSGGVISSIVGHILNVSDQNILQISQQLMNSSVTKLIATSSGLKLNYLNNYSHLEMVGKECFSYF